MRFTHESENYESLPFIGINVSRKNWVVGRYRKKFV